MLHVVAESLCEVLDLRAGERVLDVAGDGTFSLVAASRGCVVASATAQALPFVDEVFDVVVSSFGVACASGHQTTVREMLRVCRSAGRLGLAMRAPDGLMGRVFTVSGRCASAPPIRTPTPDRNLEALLEHWFRDAAFDLHTTYHDVVFRHRSAEHSVDVLRTGDGLGRGMFARLPQDAQRRLQDEVLDLIEEFNIATPPTVDVQSRYVEVVVVKE